MSESCACSCQAEQRVDAPRRRIIKIAAAAMASPLAFAADPAGASLARPTDGDRLVDEEIEGVPMPLRPTDIPLGKPVLAFPYDPEAKAVRDGSRLNKIVLMRFAEADLDAETRARSAGGVLAYSAVCTHQGCDLKTWSAKERVLVCFCHSSKFRLHEAGSVASGPAQRALPNLPLRLDGEQLVVAGSFSAPPGGQTA